MFDFSTRMSGEQPVRIVLPPTTPRTEVRVILRRLWRGSGFILLGALFMVAAAVALLGLLPPRYTSSIQVLVDPSDLRVVENDVNARQPQADSGVSIAESQVRVIQSDNVLRRVIAKLHLEQDDEFVLPDGNNAAVNWVKGALGMMPPPVSRDPVNIALDTLQNRLSVRRAERTFVIDVSVQSRDPEKAAQIANAIGDAYFAEEAAARTDTARRASDALAGRLNSLKRDVEQAEGAVVRYREDHKLMASSGRLLTDQQLGDLNQQLVTASDQDRGGEIEARPGAPDALVGSQHRPAGDAAIPRDAGPAAAIRHALPQHRRTRDPSRRASSGDGRAVCAAARPSAPDPAREGADHRDDPEGLRPRRRQRGRDPVRVSTG